MTLSKSEIEIALKQIKTWEKFEKQWPRMRWGAIVLSFAMAFAAVAGFQSIGRMRDISEQWPIITTEKYASDIKAYFDIRTNLLRAEIGIYVGAVFQACISAVILAISIVGWNRHRYIRLKILALKSLLAIKTND